ncbi:MAG TPA: ABC transporter permease subunit [Solirubrobacteraceae bacterium]|nr:ABC transporter permease subunit [Solirubrobacteraceae bacterium]
MNVVALEYTKQARRPRGLITLGVLGILTAVLTLVISVSRATIAERVGDFGSVVSNTSGLTMPLIALSATLLFLLPLAVAIFAGETVAGEAAWGSLRYLLARPVPRWRVLAAKAAVAAAFSIAAVLVVVVVSLGTGVIAFGWHALTVLDLQHTSPFIVASARFPPLAAIGRLGLATAFVLATLTSTFAFALMLSTFTVRPFSAVAGGVGLSLFSRALDNVPGLHALSPWLPVTDSGTTLWTGFFTRPMQTAGLAHLLEVQAAYVAVFLAVALARFARADILS